MMRSAAEASVSGAHGFMHLSPCEIRLEIACAAARRERALEQADLQAWLAGRYVLAAVHAPRRYPRRPDGVKARPRRMSDDEMKKVFAAMAGERRENGGS